MPTYTKKLKKGDTVQICSGKDRTKRNKILDVLPSKGQIIVEGVNMVKKHQKPKSAQKPGEIIDKTQPLYANKALLVCPKCNQGTRVGFKIVDDSKVRICKKCNQPVD